MIHRVLHRTEYTYGAAVSTSHHELHLLPRPVPGQIVREEELEISPVPAVRSDHVDWFGNRLTHLAIHERHRRLAVVSKFEIEVAPEPPSADQTSWERARDVVRAGQDAETRAALEFALPSLVP